MKDKQSGSKSNKVKTVSRNRRKKRRIRRTKRRRRRRRNSKDSKRRSWRGEGRLTGKIEDAKDREEKIRKSIDEDDE